MKSPGVPLYNVDWTTDHDLQFELALVFLLLEGGLELLEFSLAGNVRV